MSDAVGLRVKRSFQMVVYVPEATAVRPVSDIATEVAGDLVV